MRVRIPAPTLLSRITPDVDKDWKGYAISNIANVSLQTDGVVINDLLLKRLNTNSFDLRNSSDTEYRNLWSNNFICVGNLALYTSGNMISSRDADDAYALIKARQNTVGLAEIARLTGAATPTFDILAGRLTGDLNANGYYPVGKKLKVGDNLISSADTEISGTQTSYTKYKEIRTSVDGLLRVKFDLRSGTSGTLVYATIYKNGTAYGTERSLTVTYYVTFSEDLTFSAGDLIQLYCYTSNSTVSYYARNFRIYVSECEEFKVLMD